MSILLLVIGLLLMKRIKAAKDSQRYGNLLIEADGGATEILISHEELQRCWTTRPMRILMKSSRTLYKALGVAKANDNTDVDAAIVEL